MRRLASRLPAPPGKGLSQSSALANALLYFAAIDQILRADLTAPGTVKAVLCYSVIYLLPLMLIVLSRGLFWTRSDPPFGAVARFFER